jgi:hypothetical protein
VKTIIVSKALRYKQAIDFIHSMKDLFDGKLVRARLNFDNGWGKKYPMYYVVRVEKSEPRGRTVELH